MCWCAMSWCDLDLTFDLALILETVRYRKLTLGRDIGYGVYVFGIMSHCLLWKFEIFTKGSGKPFISIHCKIHQD